MPDSPVDEAPPRPWQKWIVAVLGLLVVVHSILLTLWLAPASPIRDLVGSRGLASYVDPYFEQSADSVDPDAQYVDESFQVRALVQSNTAKPKVTHWVDLTAEENQRMRFDLDPARVHVIARRLATNLNGVMFALDPQQREIVPLSKVSTLPSKLQARLNAAGSNPIAVQNFMAYSQMATQFASLYAAAKWNGGDVYQVQFKVGRRTVPPFAKRHTDKLADVHYLWFAFGWRPAFHGSYDARSAFNSYVNN